MVGGYQPPTKYRIEVGLTGRPKGTKNFKTDLREELAEPVSIRVDAKAQTVSSQRAAVKQLRAKALNGDPRVLDRLLALAERYDLEDTADASEKELAKEDQDIIERYLDRRVGEREAQKAANQNSDDEDEVQ